MSFSGPRDFTWARGPVNSCCNRALRPPPAASPASEDVGLLQVHTRNDRHLSRGDLEGAADADGARPDGQRELGPDAAGEPSRPPGEGEEDDRCRQESGAGHGRGVALHLDQVEGKPEEGAVERAVEQEREQVGAGEGR